MRREIKSDMLLKKIATFFFFVGLTSSTWHTPNSVDALSTSAKLPSFDLRNLLGNTLERNKPKLSKCLEYTHIECNGQLWRTQTKTGGDVSLVIDPIASQLDFGIPWGYRGNKVYLDEDETIQLIVDANPTHCLLTQGLDDHTHLPTLSRLVEKLPDLEFIVAPSCEKKLKSGLPIAPEKVTVLKPGEHCILPSMGSTVSATEGALVGPPWQERENGYLLEVDDELSVYYEPHSDVILDHLISDGVKADIIVAPVKRQALPAGVPKQGQFTLVFGPERALEIAEAFGASVFIPLGNGELDQEGLLTSLLQASGGDNVFEEMVKKRDESKEPIRVQRTTPGVKVMVNI